MPKSSNLDPGLPNYLNYKDSQTHFFFISCLYHTSYIFILLNFLLLPITEGFISKWLDCMSMTYTDGHPGLIHLQCDDKLYVSERGYLMTKRIMILYGRKWTAMVQNYWAVNPGTTFRRRGCTQLADDILLRARDCFVVLVKRTGLAV
jgi:hypothetical protein